MGCLFGLAFQHIMRVHVDSPCPNYLHDLPAFYQKKRRDFPAYLKSIFGNSEESLRIEYSSRDLDSQCSWMERQLQCPRVGKSIFGPVTYWF